jgi:hypothetical protein
VVVAVLAVGVLAGCGGKDGFDSEAYCAAIVEPGVTLDAKALIEGDKATLDQARRLYTSIRDQAPEELVDEWDLLIRELESMSQTARGDRAVEDSNYEAFSEAFAAIELDKHDRCPTAP